MSNYSKSDVVLIRYPFSDLSGSKVRPAVIVSVPHASQDLFIVPLTSRITSLLPGEFVLSEWRQAGLNVPTAVKRGIYTVQENLIAKSLGHLSNSDSKRLSDTLRSWLSL